MNVKTNKTKKQANVENQAVNLLSKEELCKRIEGVEKELKSYTWRELETNGKFAKEHPDEYKKAAFEEYPWGK